MDLFQLTRALVDIDSVTPNEEKVGLFLFDHLSELAARTGGRVERIEVEPHRYNVLAHWGDPVVTLSTHMDTVPPFFASREDAEFIWGRGACDTKGIIASMIHAAEALVTDGVRGIALLFVVGEERNSAGAYAAAKDPRGSRYLINGEPTENKLALGSKGALRYEIIAQGRMAHSAYPHLGESAIEKLLDALERIRRIPMPSDAMLGASTLNIGTIQGGRAPNVIPDHARAEVFIRLVDSGDSIRARCGRGVRRVRPRRKRSCTSRPCIWARWRVWRPPSCPIPPTFRHSTERGASRFFWDPAASTSRTPMKSGFPRRNCWKRLRFIKNLVRQLLQQ